MASYNQQTGLPRIVTENTGRTTKEWYFFNVPSYALLKLVLNSSEALVTLRRSANAVKLRPLQISIPPNTQIERERERELTEEATSFLL
jgi:hypothetical protein